MLGKSKKGSSQPAALSFQPSALKGWNRARVRELPERTEGFNVRQPVSDFLRYRRKLRSFLWSIARHQREVNFDQ
jgi:hypothetical protein